MKKKILSSHDFFQLSRYNKKQENIVVQWSSIICWWFNKYIWCIKWHLKRLTDCFFITNQNRCKKTYIVFINSFERKKGACVFFNFHSSKKIIMLMECSFKSGVLKLKIHKTNLVLPEKEAILGYNNFNPRASSFVTW